MKSPVVKWQARTPSSERLQGFLKYAERFSETTQKTYKGVLWRFYQYMPKYIENLTVEHIERFVESAKVTNSTKNKNLNVVRSFCRYLADFYGLPNHCKKIQRLREEPRKQKIITDEQYRQILEACKNQKQKDVLKFLSNTGLRDAEFRNLTWQNVSNDRQYLTVISKRHRRIIPLNQTCREILTRKSNSIYIFESYHKKTTLYKLFQTLSKRAGLPIVASSHSYRHKFCTDLIRAGVPITKVSKIMGHASIAITERIYLHFLPVDFIGCTDVLD